jgi:hypothetical protein
MNNRLQMLLAGGVVAALVLGTMTAGPSPPSAAGMGAVTLRNDPDADAASDARKRPGPGERRAPRAGRPTTRKIARHGIAIPNDDDSRDRASDDGSLDDDRGADNSRDDDRGEDAGRDEAGVVVIPGGASEDDDDDDWGDDGEDDDDDVGDD